MRRFDEKVALVTGAGHGIGRASATRLAAEGATVVVTDVDTDAAQAVAAELDNGVALHMDVTDADSVARALAAVTERYARLDVLVNNVGIAGKDSFADIDETEWHRQTDPTLLGAVRCIKACLPQLLAAPGGGAVVSIASVNGMAAVGGTAYSAAKAGLINLTSNLSVEYGPRRQDSIGAEHGWIRFNAVAPGTIRTRAWDGQGDRLDKLAQLYPMGRVGEPDDIAAAVAFLASSDASWITGVTLPVDGGFLTGPATMFQSLR
jgi:meso-butanediol dehydrogenase/(S,S)-butanediol dehydrogenase/diacetyl reductase